MTYYMVIDEHKVGESESLSEMLSAVKGAVKMGFQKIALCQYAWSKAYFDLDVIIVDGDIVEAATGIGGTLEIKTIDELMKGEL